MTPDPEATRYHVYALRPNGRLVELASTSKDGIGSALVQLHEDCELVGCTVGVLDRAEEGERGTWIVNPFPPSRRSRV